MDPTLEDINNQMYAETAPTEPGPVGPPAPVADAPAPAGVSLISEDGGSFTVSGPNGIATFPKNFADPETGAAHQELYNHAAAASNVEPSQPTAPVISAPAPILPLSPPASTSIQPMEGGGAVPVPQPRMASANPGFTTVNLTDTQKQIYDPKELQGERDAQKVQLKLADDAIKTQTAINAAKTAQADAVRLENQKFIDDELARRTEEDNQKKERLAAYDTAKNNFAGLSVDSNRLWHNASTGDKVLATVAMALSGMGAALQGKSGNSAWDIIEKKIDQDIDEQKTNINQKGRELDSQRTAYQDFLRATGDERVARLATKDLALQKVSDEFQKRIDSSTNDLQIQNLQMGKAGVDERIHHNNAEMTKIIATTKPEVVKTKGAGNGTAQPDATVLKAINESENGLDKTARLVDELNSGKIDSGLFASFRNAASRKLGNAGNVDSKRLQAQMKQEFVNYVHANFGSSMTDSEKASAEEAAATFDQNPKVAAGILQDMLTNRAEQAAAQRKTFEHTYDVGPSQSKYLNSYMVPQSTR